MTVHDAGLQFSGALAPRRMTDAIILHHAAASACSVEDVHRWHLANGWAGIGYHYLVRKDGTVWRGRPENTVGAHAGSENGWNARSVGVCFEGDFESETMSGAQLGAGAELLRDILARYAGCRILGHRDVAATACPGGNFPFEKIKEMAAMDIRDVSVKIGGSEMAAKLIDGVTYVPLREFIDRLEAALTVTWTRTDGAGVELK